MITEIKATQAVAIQPEPRTKASLGGCICAGYMLQERLGVGGYGEVWRAVGPGGLHKAVKILHGFQDGPQAELELKSLERMRDLRHPFLLNIERIEVDQGRLVIVTELAEGSLEDRFEQLVRDGRQGLPREELLAYLRDASDALVPQQRAILLATAGSLVTIATLGAGYLIMLAGIDTVDEPWLVVSAFAIAWLVGFVLVPLPSGLGAREAVLVGLLHSAFPASVVVAASVYHRLVQIATEGLMALIASHRVRPSRLRAAATQVEELS